MDKQTKQKIQLRIKQLEQKRAELASQMIAINGAIAELQQWINQPPTQDAAQETDTVKE